MSTSGARPLLGQVAMVTGAASGIGRATALRLAADGARVAVADVDPIGLERVVETLRREGGEGLVLRLDVTAEEDWIAGIRRTRTEWGRLDLLVNGAGVAAARPIMELDLAEWRRVLAVNLDGVFLGTRHAFRAMAEGGGGCIVNLASLAGIEPYGGNAVYGTSKAAIRFFTRIAALEGEPHRIRVNSISPGAVATPMWRGTPEWPGEVEAKEGLEAALRELGRGKDFSPPERVAETVAFLASAEGSHLTGRDFTLDDEPSGSS